MHRPNLHDVGASDLVPPCAIRPKSQDAGQVAVWDGIVTEVIQYEVTLSHVDGHAGEGVEDLRDLVHAEDVTSRYEANECEADGHPRQWSEWTWGSLAGRSAEWRGWAVRKVRIRGCWKVGTVGSGGRWRVGRAWLNHSRDGGGVHSRCGWVYRRGGVWFVLKTGDRGS